MAATVMRVAPLLPALFPTIAPLTAAPPPAQYGQFVVEVSCVGTPDFMRLCSGICETA